MGQRSNRQINYEEFDNGARLRSPAKFMESSGQQKKMTNCGWRLPRMSTANEEFHGRMWAIALAIARAMSVAIDGSESMPNTAKILDHDTVRYASCHLRDTHAEVSFKRRLQPLTTTRGREKNILRGRFQSGGWGSFNSQSLKRR